LMQRAHILIVEDDPGVAKALAGLLGDEGHRTTHVPSAERGWDVLFGGDPPDLVLLDVRLPGESGLDLLARLPSPCRRRSSSSRVRRARAKLCAR
jgi:CheY-like chemotaxis protein